MFQIILQMFLPIISENNLSANPTEWSNLSKQIVFELRMCFGSVKTAYTVYSVHFTVKTSYINH